MHRRNRFSSLSVQPHGDGHWEFHCGSFLLAVFICRALRLIKPVFVVARLLRLRFKFLFYLEVFQFWYFISKYRPSE